MEEQGRRTYLLDYWLLRTVIRIRVWRRRQLVFKISNLKQALGGISYVAS
jgi:hypothetical protein